MTTSGTYNTIANFNFAQIIDDAFRRCRVAPSEINGEHMLSARISLDLMFIGWVNDGVQQFVIDEITQPLVGDGTDTNFTAPVGTVDILSMIFRNASSINVATDMEISAISRKDYQDISQKDAAGQPVNYFVDKTTIPPVIYLWPVQNITGTSVVYNRVRQIQDAGAYANTPDTTVLYKEAIVACLADLLWVKYGDDAKHPGHGDNLIARAMKSYEMAKDQDRDRAQLVIKPYLGRRF